jgi:hypothetical protein
MFGGKLKKLQLSLVPMLGARKGRLFSKIVFGIFSVLLSAENVHAISKELADSLPRPEAIFLTAMKDIEGQDSSLSTNYWKAVNELCAEDPFPKSLCVLPTKIKKLNKLIKTIFAKKGNVLYPDDMSRRNLWDVRELAAANFLVLPSPQGPEATLKTIVEIFALRNEILRDLERVQLDIKKRNQFPDMHMLLTIPFIRATVYSASPLGAALTIFNSMKCKPKEKLCDILKSRQGGVINVLVENSTLKIANLYRRLQVATNDEASEQSRRLRQIFEFAEKIQNDQVVLTREELTTGFTELVGLGQGAYADMAYQDLARKLIIFAEASLVNKMSVNFSVYNEELSKAEKQRVKKQLYPLVQQSIDAIELGFVTVGLNNELED